jgi:F-type H+-transporting ATPase subunit delta
MIDQAPLARPYGKALFDAALEAKDLDGTHSAIQELAKISETKEVALFIDEPTHTKKEIANKLIEILGGSINDLTVKLLNVLAENKRLNLISNINIIYTELLEKHNQQTNVSVSIATDVSEETKEHLLTKLKKSYGDNTSIAFKIDPSIMGGLSVMVGDESLDLSIKGRVKKLINQLNF